MATKKNIKTKRRASVPKPVSDEAKAQAALDATARNLSPTFDRDVIEYGRATAHFNAGFCDGHNNGQENLAIQILPLIKELSANVGGKWSPDLRRIFDSNFRKLEQLVAAKKKRNRRQD